MPVLHTHRCRVPTQDFVAFVSPRALIGPPPVAALFKSDVVNQVANASKLLEQGFLFAGRRQSVAIAAMQNQTYVLLSFTFQSTPQKEPRVRPALKDGVSAWDSDERTESNPLPAQRDGAGEKLRAAHAGLPVPARQPRYLPPPANLTGD